MTRREILDRVKLCRDLLRLPGAAPAVAEMLNRLTFELISDVEAEGGRCTCCGQALAADATSDLCYRCQ